MTSTQVALWALAAAMIAPVAAEGQKAKDKGPQRADSSFRWTGTVAAGATLAIKGVNGAVVATGTNGKEVKVRAVKRYRRSDPASVDIRVVQESDGTTICAVYPDNTGSGCSMRSDGHSNHWEENDVNVDFTVEVPNGVRLDASTVNGDVDASGITADAEATSVNGDVTLATSGVGSAATVNGSVRLRLGKSAWSGEVEAKTVNGTIVVEMPTPTDLDVRASMLNGDFESDFPITIQGKASRRSIKGTIGKGGPELALQTVNGGIELRRVN